MYVAGHIIVYYYGMEWNVNHDAMYDSCAINQ